MYGSLGQITQLGNDSQVAHTQLSTMAPDAGDSDTTVDPPPSPPGPATFAAASESEAKQADRQKFQIVPD